MRDGAENPITRTLQAAVEGDRQAAAELLPLVYEELRKLARSQMAKLRPGQTLQATALVHEAFLRVAGTTDPGWEGRGHFFSAAARAMRDILIEHARHKSRIKRGGGRVRQEIEPLPLAIDAPTDDLLALHESLQELEMLEPRKHELVMLRSFAGLTVGEAAEVLGISVRTAERDWRYTKAWLRRRIKGSEGGDCDGDG